jgi:hypothetical protein
MDKESRPSARQQGGMQNAAVGRKTSTDAGVLLGLYFESPPWLDFSPALISGAASLGKEAEGSESTEATRKNKMPISATRNMADMGYIAFSPLVFTKQPLQSAAFLKKSRTSLPVPPLLR